MLIASLLAATLFTATTPLPKEIQEKIAGHSWKEDAPVALDDLAYLRISYWNMENEESLGEMIVHKTIADKVLGAFQELFEARFPIERMELVEAYDTNDDLSMEANNSSAFCFRPNVTYPHLISLHGYGLAIDINPRINPYHNWEKKIVAPSSSVEFLDRTRSDVPGMIQQDDVCYRAFTSRGFEWGGDWTERRVDYQHFQIQLDAIKQ